MEIVKAEQIELRDSQSSQEALGARLAARISRFKTAWGKVARAQNYVIGLMWRHERGVFFLCIGLGVAQGISVPLFSYALGESLEVATANQSMWSQAIILLCVAVALMGVVPMLIQLLNRELVEWLFGLVQGTLVEKVASLDAERFADPKLRGMFQRLSMRLVWKLIEFSFSLYPLIKGLVGASIASIILWHGAPELLLLVGVSVIPAMLMEARFARRYCQMDEGCTTKIRSFWDGFHLGTTSQSVHFRQSVGSAKRMAKDFAAQALALVGVYRSCNQTYAWLRVSAAMLSQICVAYALLNLVSRFSSGAIGISESVLLIGGVSLLGSSLSEAAGAIGQQVGLSLYVEDWLVFLDTKPWIVRTTQKSAMPEVSRGISVELRGVKFAYGARGKPKGFLKDDRMVIKGITLEIAAGEKCALLAPNGAGKTTLSNLLAGLMEPTEGSVSLGGVSVQDFDEETLRNLVAYLPQDFARYTMTVEQYIALSSTGESVDHERVRRAAERSGANIFIEKWSKGYQTLLGHDYEGGESPSGGQLQKLVLAMMFYKNAPLMLLDEPTAAVDPESARDFWDHLLHQCPGHTVIFSTHYLGAVRRADKIILLAEGRIADVGTHAELILRNATYQRIFRSQADDFR